MRTARRAHKEVTGISWGRKSKDPIRQRELKKDAVLKAAATEFLARGYRETTIDHICTRLNVTKPSVYSYVDNKEQILVECSRLGYERLDRLLNEVTEEEGSALDRLRTLFRGYAEYALDEFGRCLITLGDRPQVKENKEFIRGRRADIQARIKQLVASGIEDGSIRQCRPAHVAEILVSTFNGLHTWFKPSGDLSLQEIADQLLDLIFFGAASSRVGMMSQGAEARSVTRK
jgi:AcrR family transcriptional regulator